MNWMAPKANSEMYYQQQVGHPMCRSGATCLVSQNECISYGPFQSKQNVSEYLIQQKENDKDFINKFLLCKKKHNINIVPKPLKLSEAKCLLSDIISLKQELEKKANNFNNWKINSSWSTVEHQMDQIKEKIFKLEKNIEPLKKFVVRKLKIRDNRKRRKIRKNALKKKLKKQIMEKHEIIDKRLDERKNEVEYLKREAALKRQADSVLHDVRRKKYEATKMLNLLSTLAKLRELRIHEEKKNGGYCSTKLTETFNAVIERFLNLWGKQIEVYKLEERGLKIMLEGNTLPYIKHSQVEMNLLQWEEVLFGPIPTKNMKNLTSVTEDTQEFIKVRQEWDQYITSEATAVSSCIPLGWILPPETNDVEWLKYIVKSKNLQE